ncbi:MAG: hypothetical protein ACRERU_10910 [Methylococcales bacterium]
MKRLLKKIFILVVVFGINQATIAANDLGSFSGGLTDSFSLSLANGLNTWSGSVTENGSFTHTYNLGSLTDLIGVGIPINFSFNLGGLFPISSQITGLSLSLFDSANTNVGIFGPFLPNNIVLGAFLPPGNYHLDISGISSGTINDIYGVAVLAAIPEPEEWAMMVVGLLLVSMQIARERKRKTSRSFSIEA